MKTLEQILSELPLLKGKSWSPEEQEVLYEAAYLLYEQGKYAEARGLFLQLVCIAPFVEKYWRGHASSLQMEAQYSEALQAWAICALFVEGDPLPHYHAAQCLCSLNQREDAMRALDCALQRIGDDAAHPLKVRIELLRSCHVSNT